MTLSEIFENITIVADKSYIQLPIYSLTASALLTLLTIVAFIAAVATWQRLTFSRVLLFSAPALVGIAGVALVYILLINTNIFTHVELTVCANDVSLTELSNNFEISDLTEIDDSVYVTIAPKADNKDEICEILREKEETLANG